MMKNRHEMLQNTSFLSHPITQPSQSQIYFLNVYLCCFKFRYFYSIFNHDVGTNCDFTHVNTTVLKNAGFVYEIQFSICV
jgi:hypothetical protein